MPVDFKSVNRFQAAEFELALVGAQLRRKESASSALSVDPFSPFFGFSRPKKIFGAAMLVLGPLQIMLIVSKIGRVEDPPWWGG
jgi:hypothetical protein